jgi:hypothetical protein
MFQAAHKKSLKVKAQRTKEIQRIKVPAYRQVGNFKINP